MAFKSSTTRREPVNQLRGGACPQLGKLGCILARKVVLARPQPANFVLHNGECAPASRQVKAHAAEHTRVVPLGVDRSKVDATEMLVACKVIECHRSHALGVAATMSCDSASQPCHL